MPIPNRSILRICFQLADGETLERQWFVDDLDVADAATQKIAAEVPIWLNDYGKKWDHPQDPITFFGKVTEGFESKAREWIDAL